MIAVEIHMDPLGSEVDRETLALVAIWNDASGDFDFGNYGWAISHQFDSSFGRAAAKKSGRDKPTALEVARGGPWVWKSGSIKAFPRQKGAVALLAAVMRAARL